MIVRGAEIDVERIGTGLDLVWGHGLTQSRLLEDRRTLIDWTEVPARVVRYDARGHGVSESTTNLDGYRWDELARDQLELATGMDIHRYIAAGASMGAATALHAAVLAPDRVRGLVLVIPPTGWETRAEQAGTYEVGAEVIESRGIETLIAAGANVAPPDPFVGDLEYREQRAAGLRSWDPDRLARAMRGAARAQLPSRDDIESIACPTLVLAWTGDPVHPVSTADELGRLIPSADVHIASSAAELSTWTQLVADFVSARSSHPA
ncbi:alpha/beta fold hydrolase [Ilumatobacter nonamiensis]|uniref:alpha/beta fold hydrolase n=1 Tax=Ilumatobacter nonamiensis TaxID=467093 RepID=UPI000344C0DD|nr:alpha/beta fold hydrolase [Ilumatobacter nonamiensis]